MKPLVIYHDNCTDGFGAAFAAWLKLGDEAEYQPCQYNTPEQLHWDKFVEHFGRVEGREVYILDFSFKRPIMDLLFEQAGRVIWLDHHKTAFEMWRGKYERGMFWPENSKDDRKVICLDDNRSGAILAWEYFHHDQNVPPLFRHIDDYDRWQFKIWGTKEINKYLWSLAPWSFEQWNTFLEDVCGFEGRGIMINIGAAILRAHEQNVQSVVKGSARECWIKAPEPIDLPGSFLDEVTQGWQGLAANCPPHLTSDVGHELATQSGTFGLLWFIDKGNICRCSLRSNGDYDVSAIAKAFKGGGHRNAAGFTVDIQALVGWIK